MDLNHVGYFVLTEKSMKQQTGVILTAICGLVLPGCFGNREIPDVKKVVELPKTYTKPQNLKAPEVDQWCSDFGDKKLKSLIDQAFSKNLNMRLAWVRLKQSQTVARQVASNLYPTVDASAQATRQQTAFNSPQGQFTINNSIYRPQLAAGYEVDLWGRLAAQRKAARLDAKASRADLESIAISVASEVAEAWFDLLQQRQKRKLLDEQIKINERYVELLVLRLQIARASALDVNQQQQQIDSLKNQRLTVAAAEKLAMIRLAALLGQSLNDFKLSVDQSTLPDVPEMPKVGVPAALLQRRPDLRAAQIRLKAANKRIAVAVRSRLPTLRLSASLFLQATAVTELLDTLLWNIAAQAAAPLVDGGRRRADVTLAELRQDEAVLNYANTLLTALNDVERAMLQEQQQVQTIQLLTAQQKKAQQALTLAKDRFQRGLVDYLRVLTTIQALQQLEQGIIDAKRRQLTNRVGLCRALGGTWTTKLKMPKKLVETSKSLKTNKK